MKIDIKENKIEEPTKDLKFVNICLPIKVLMLE